MKTLPAKIKLIQGGKVPHKKDLKDACYDMYAREIRNVCSGLFEVRLGVAIQPPEGYRVAIYPRSSISKTGWILANSVGVGDENYTGEYMAYFAGLPDGIDPFQEISFSDPAPMLEYMPFPYEVGDRVCQMELVEYNQIDFTVVDELDSTTRGDGGFGSSGNNSSTYV